MENINRAVAQKQTRSIELSFVDRRLLLIASLQLFLHRLHECPDPKVAAAIIDAGVCSLSQDRTGNPAKTTKINACAAWLRAQLRGSS